MKQLSFKKLFNDSRGQITPTVAARSAWWTINEIPGLTIACFHTTEPNLNGGWVVMGFHHLKDDIEEAESEGREVLDIIPKEKQLGYKIFTKLEQQVFSTRTEALEAIKVLAYIEESVAC